MCYHCLCFSVSFSVLVVVYIVGGVLFMKFARGAEGKEVIPNVNFWSELPGNIKVVCYRLNFT